jgi:restriction system protein
MAENSLFAILLRSPWWASLGIAVALALLMRLLLPADYAVAGMLGSFPFVVIAAMAGWKQLRAPSATQLAQTLERLQAMNSREFAEAIEAAFRAQGHEVTRLNQPGADLELMLRHRRTVVAFRRWKAASIGVEPLRELQAAKTKLEAEAAMFVATGTLSEKAGDGCGGRAFRPAGRAGQQRRHRRLQAAARDTGFDEWRGSWPSTWTAPFCAPRPPRR